MSKDEAESEDECENIEVKLEGTTFTRLTEIVRNQYLKFLKKQLEDNLRTCWSEVEWKAENSRIEELAQKCAQNLEELAIKEATLTQLYQRAMVKMIDTVRGCTKEYRLLDEMQLMLNFTEPKSLTCNTATKATQTEHEEEPAPTLTLDERINLLQNHINLTPSVENFNFKTSSEQRKRRTDSQRKDYDRKRLSRTRSLNSEHNALATPIWHSPTPPPQPQLLKQTNANANTASHLSSQATDAFEEQLAGDEVAEELEKLFMEQETDFEEIFGVSLKTNLSNCDNENSVKEENVNVKIQTKENCVENSTNNLIVGTPSISAVHNSQIYRQPVQDLRHSPWPCERFMRKRLLSGTLTRLVEEDIRWFEILKIQFTLLFGDCVGDMTHDDFAPCSPSLELDEIIISSCMRRISPWVVRHLMKPLQDGLIGNRFLFKKLAKKLAYHITTENQYPNELVIKNAVENFFCLHRAVMTVDDLNDIDVAIVNNV